MAQLTMYSAICSILTLMSVISGAAAKAVRDGGHPIVIDSYEPISAIQYRDLIDSSQPETFNHTKISSQEYEDLEDFVEVDIKAIIKEDILGRREALTSQKLRFLENPLANSGNFEGDIILPPRRGSESMREWGNAGISDFYRFFNNPNLWTNGVVPYLISSHYGEYGRMVILSAMQEFHRYTCIRFVPRITTHYHFIIISPRQGCASHIGRRGGGQYLSLVGGCLEKKTVIHQFMHTLGFVHYPFNNGMRTVSKNDLTSSMEYQTVSGGGNFGKGGSTTYTFRNGDGLSPEDAMSINTMYGCPQQYPVESRKPA